MLCVAAATQARPLVLVFDELPPWKTFKDGRYGGAYTEIVRELGRRIGADVEIVQCPLKRCMSMLEQGLADIAIGYKDTPERRRFLHFLATPYRNHSADRVFYLIPEQGVEVRSYTDLATLRIGIKLGAEYFERFDKDAALNKAAVRDTETNFRKLALGRLDTLIVPEDQGEAVVAKLGMRDKVSKAVYRQPDPTPRAIAIGLNSPYASRVAELEQAMSAMVKDGTLEALYKRHYYDALRIPVAAVQIR